jgi:hypothetical protein
MGIGLVVTTVLLEKLYASSRKREISDNLRKWIRNDSLICRACTLVRLAVVSFGVVSAYKRVL